MPYGKEPKVGDNIMIIFKAYTGKYWQPGNVKSVNKKSITIEWGGHELTYLRKNIQSIDVS
jgi:hypothetical protein